MSAPSSQPDPDKEVTERLHDQYSVFQQGDSRVFSVPAGLECEVGDGIEVRIGQNPGCTAYLCGFMSSLDREEEIAARTEAIRRSDAESESYLDCNDIRAHGPGKIMTIPSDCDNTLFRRESDHLLFVGRVDGSVGYLKYVPKGNIRLDGASR